MAHPKTKEKHQSKPPKPFINTQQKKYYNLCKQRFDLLMLYNEEEGCQYSILHAKEGAILMREFNFELIALI